MKKLGLVGGMGPESTIPYYHDIIYGVHEKLGENIFPELTIESVNVFQILKLCREKKYDELTGYLLHAIQNLANTGADFAALTANTPHIVFDRLKEKSPIRLISIIETTCNEACHRNYERIGLLGTIFTMEEDFFKEPFRNKNIDIILPTSKEMIYINDKITNELELGIVNSETLVEFQSIIDRMKLESKIEAIVLGCTELPLLLNDDVCSVPCLDTMKIHIHSLIDMIIEK